MASCVLGVAPEGWSSASVLELPIACFEVTRKHPRFELLTPSTPSESVKVPDENLLDFGMVNMGLNFAPMLLEVIIFNLALPRFFIPWEIGLFHRS
jgi:hypothetical protein